MASAGAQAAIHHDHRVAQFGTGIVAAGINLMVDNDTAAHASAQSDGDGVVSALQGTRHVLAVGRGIGIILHKDLFTLHTLGKHLLHGRIFKGQVVGKLDDARGLIDGAGRANSHPGHIGQCNAGVLQSGIGRLSHSVRHLLGVFQLCFRGSPRDDLVILIHDADGNIGAAQVNS